MFRKSFSSITSSLSRAIIDLERFKEEQLASAAKRDQEAKLLRQQANLKSDEAGDAREDAVRAERVAAKIKDLIA